MDNCYTSFVQIIDNNIKVILKCTCTRYYFILFSCIANRRALKWSVTSSNNILALQLKCSGNISLVFFPVVQVIFITYEI